MRSDIDVQPFLCCNCTPLVVQREDVFVSDTVGEEDEIRWNRSAAPADYGNVGSPACVWACREKRNGPRDFFTSFFSEHTSNLGCSTLVAIPGGVIVR